MPKGQKRPADTVPNAIRVAKILTGEVEEDVGDSVKDRNAQALGRGGRSRTGEKNHAGASASDSRERGKGAMAPRIVLSDTRKDRLPLAGHLLSFNDLIGIRHR